jgi:DNA-binding transcriptional LysR family regulator
VVLEVRVDANLKLRDEVERGDLDLAVLFQEPGERLNRGGGCEVIARMRRVWVSSPGFHLPDVEPTPLVLSNGPCIFRNAVLGALDAIGRPWRIALSTPSLAGLRAALRAGLGIGVRTECWLEPDLRILDGVLPPLPDVELALLTAADTGEVVVEKLRAALIEALRLPGPTAHLNGRSVLSTTRRSTKLE